jgi:hypothetical protein
MDRQVHWFNRFLLVAGTVLNLVGPVVVLAVAVYLMWKR